MGGNVASTSAARAAGTKVELDLSTIIDATVMLTVALAANAVINAITANAPPAFSAATATRSVPENSPASTHVGAPVTATDGDNDPLTYTLEGTAPRRRPRLPPRPASPPANLNSAENFLLDNVMAPLSIHCKKMLNELSHFRGPLQ